MKKKNKESISDKLKLPKDITMGSCILTAVGDTEIWIENYRGIIEYTDEMIHIQGKNTHIIIEGKRLVIDYYSNEDMKILGCIRTIRYQ
ncbi:MAG: YabP/YqfC family sporulation protein [Lachnospiraceae bacterium]|nr:YabP/YqfC family sporulation protein [Lachnospiraceae bacterium]